MQDRSFLGTLGVDIVLDLEKELFILQKVMTLPYQNGE
jgi:hypothetical protein